MFGMPMDRRTCLMGVNVHLGTRIVAFISLAACTMFAVPLVFSHVLYSRAQFHGFDGFNGPMASGFSVCVFLVAVAVNAGLLVGNLARHSVLYLPFIFVNVAAALVVTLILLLAAVFGGIGLFHPDFDVSSTPDLLDATSVERVHSRTSEIANFALMSVMLTSFVVLMALGLALHCYVISVVWRGYRFLCKYEDLDDEAEIHDVKNAKENAERTDETQANGRF